MLTGYPVWNIWIFIFYFFHSFFFVDFPPQIKKKLKILWISSAPLYIHYVLLYLRVFIPKTHIQLSFFLFSHRFLLLCKIYVTRTEICVYEYVCVVHIKSFVLLLLSLLSYREAPFTWFSLLLVYILALSSLLMSWWWW